MDEKGYSFALHLFASNQRKEHVEGDLDTVDEDKSVLGGDELEVDRMDNGPDLPRSLACRKQVVLDLVTNGSERVSVHQTEVGEEDGHEDGAPDDLIKGNLHGNGLSVTSGDFRVQPVVEVVSRRSVVQETKGGKGDESLDIEGSASDEDLSQKVTKGPSDQGSAGLGSQRIFVQGIVVGSPSGNSTSSDLGGVAEERAGHRRVLAQRRRRLAQGTSVLLLDGVGGDTEGRSDRKKTKESKKLHFQILKVALRFPLLAKQ